MAPVTTAADDSLEYNYFLCCSEKMRLDISCESSARQRIYVSHKHQALFSSKDKSKKNKSVVCCNFAWLFKGKYVCQPNLGSLPRILKLK